MIIRAFLMGIFFIANTSSLVAKTYSCKWQLPNKKICQKNFEHDELGSFYTHLLKHNSNKGGIKLCRWESCRKPETICRKHLITHLNSSNIYNRVKQDPPKFLKCLWLENDENQELSCAEYFESKIEFYKHCNSHIPPKGHRGNIPLCKWRISKEGLCHMLFSDRQSFLEHLRTHTKEFSFYCETCKKGSHTHGAAIIHKRRCTEFHKPKVSKITYSNTSIEKIEEDSDSDYVPKSFINRPPSSPQINFQEEEEEEEEEEEVINKSIALSPNIEIEFCDNFETTPLYAEYRKEESGILECTLCDLFFEDESTFLTHLAIHHYDIIGMPEALNLMNLLSSRVEVGYNQ